MRIVRLTAENVKRLKAVEIQPNGDVVVIAGRNGQGKTSVLDSIWFALGGGAAQKGTQRPIRDGEEQAQVTLDLGDLVVTRTWKGDKSVLTVGTQDGATYNSPQTLLDKLIGRLSFDPLAFTQQDERSQLATLLDLVELPFDPDELAAKRKTLYDQRTEVGREIKALEGQLVGLPEASNLPMVERSAADILEEQRQWQLAVVANDDRFDRKMAAGHRREDAESALRETEEKMARLRSGMRWSRYWTTWRPRVRSTVRASISSRRATSASGTALNSLAPARKTRKDMRSSSWLAVATCLSVLSADAIWPAAPAMPLGSRIMMTLPSPRIVLPT